MSIPVNPPPEPATPPKELATVPEAVAVPYAIEDPDPPGPAEESAPGYSVARVLRALRRRWYFALPAGAAGAAVLTYVAATFVRADYTARTQVFVSASQPVALADLNMYQRRQTALVKGRHVLQTALERPGVADLALVRDTPDPVGGLERDLKADFSVAPEILRLTLTGPDPGELVTLLDAIREAYLAEGVNKEVTDKKANLDRLRGLIDEDRARLDVMRLAVGRSAEKLRASDVMAARQRHQANLTRLAFVQTQVFQLEGQLRGYVETRADLEAHPPKAEPDTPVRAADLQAATDVALSKDGSVRAAQAEVDRLADDVAQDQRVAAGGAKNPKVQEKERALGQARERLAAAEQAVRDETARKLQADTGRTYEFRLREHQARLADLKMQLDRTRGQIAASRAEAEKLDEDTLTEARGLAELDRLAARTNEIEDRIKAAATRAEGLEVELRAPPRAQTLEAAVIAQAPNPGKRYRMIGAAALIGLLAGLLAVAVFDLRAGRIDTREEVDRHLRTGIVGYIPRVTPGAIAALARSAETPADRDAAMLCDAADACRALLLNALPGGDAPVIMVTSPEAGEGKTSLASQLALSLGRAGYRTLLIDADLRRASVHALFGRSQSPGLADVLRRTHAVERVGRRTQLSSLVVLPAGSCHPNEAVPLLQLRLGPALRKCKSFFDVILVDTPPLTLPDAIVVGRHADGTILSLMNEVSTLPAAQAACARLRALNLPLLGAVLNGARTRTPYGY